MSDNINEILNQLGEAESNDLTLSDLISVVHKSLIYSQHNIRFTELEELKNQYNVTIDESTGDTTLAETTININGTDVNQAELTKQNSLTINETNIHMKVNLGDIIERNNKKEVLISKYNEAESGISTELDIKLNLDTNLISPS
tara:strand:+ start:1339 stop:1770 length:432 start_codon:yes stop_codon:yes gene_type:complete